MNDEHLLRALGTWLKASDIVPPDAWVSADQVMSRVSQTPQRSRLRFVVRPSAVTRRHAERGRAPARGFSTFSAMRLVAATAIVALFGAILLWSVTHAPPDVSRPPVVSDSPSLLEQVDRLSLLEFEDVEPGVRRVVSDGVRDLRWEVPTDWEGWGPFDGAWLASAVGNISVGPNGFVWVVWDDELVRLGDEGTLPWSSDLGVATAYHQLEVAPDGRLWHADGELVSYGAEGASVHVEPAGRDIFWDLEALPDGSVWALTSLSGSTVGRYARDGWHAIRSQPPSEGRNLAADDDGGLWLEAGVYEGKLEWRLLHHVDGSWQEVETPEGAWTFDVGADGTVWLGLGWDEPSVCEAESCAAGPLRLARGGDGGWIEFGPGDGLPLLGPTSYAHPFDPLAAPDGSVWVKPAADATVHGTDCDGVANFDGEAWSSYLSGLCVYAMDVAPDGSLWALAGKREAWGPRERKRPERNTALEGAPAGPVELYVIGRVAGE